MIFCDTDEITNSIIAALYEFQDLNSGCYYYKISQKTFSLSPCWLKSIKPLTNTMNNHRLLSRMTENHLISKQKVIKQKLIISYSVSSWKYHDNPT